MSLYLLGLLLLLSAASTATAVPLSDLEKTLIQMLKKADERTEVQATGCSSRSHKVYYDIGSKTYTYRYRACLNQITQLMCYDNREILPEFCPLSFRGQDCIEIEWKIHGSTKRFEICDRFGVPCQKRIPGLGRSNYKGECSSYRQPQPHPHPHPYPHPVHPHPHPRPELHPHSRPCQQQETAEKMGEFDDCFCVMKGKKRICHGKKCHELEIAEKAGELDDCFCVIKDKKRICHGKKCP